MSAMADFDYNREFILDDDNPEIVSLTDEDGLEEEFVVVACVQVQGQYFALLLPAAVTEDDQEDDIAYAFAVHNDGIDTYFEYVDDEDVITQVFERYDALYADAIQ